MTSYKEKKLKSLRKASDDLAEQYSKYLSENQKAKEDLVEKYRKYHEDLNNQIDALSGHKDKEKPKPSFSWWRAGKYGMDAELDITEPK